MRKKVKGYLWSSLVLGGLVLTTPLAANAEEGHKVNDSDKQAVTKVSSQKVFEKNISGFGNAKSEQNRLKRSYSFSPLQPTGAYAQKGDVLTIVADGDITKNTNVKVSIGSPVRNTQKAYDMVPGENTITVVNEGPVYVINNNNDGSVRIKVSGATGVMPYFELGKTTSADFAQQMATMTDAKDIQLRSRKAIITVSYKSAKAYMIDPEVLMNYYDTLLDAQDEFSGLGEGMGDVNKLDRHYQHYVESNVNYMYATSEYLGFTGTAAMARLLNTNNGWGPWHESGHQRQQTPWKWGGLGEVTVNLYSMASQKAINGKITASDKFFVPATNYLEGTGAKDFNAQSIDLKLVMFNQLQMAFGEDFYPTLHQLYRERSTNVSSTSDQMQLYAVISSEVAGVNLIPFYEKWGYSITTATKEKLSNLPTLTDEIWKNTNLVSIQRPIKLIERVDFKNNQFSVTMVDFKTKPYEKETLVAKKNGVAFAQLTKGVASANSQFSNGVWSLNEPVADSDTITVEVYHGGRTIQLYTGAQNFEKLKEALNQLMDQDGKLVSGLTQQQLDSYRETINKMPSDDKAKLTEQLNKIEQKFLEGLIADVRYNSQNEVVTTFANDLFKNYKIVTIGNGAYLSEVTNGKVYYSYLSGKDWRTSATKWSDTIRIEVRRAYKTFTIYATNRTELNTRRDVDQLLNADGGLAETTTQERLDELKNRISQFDSPRKGELLEKVDVAQTKLFETILENVQLNPDSISVTFANDVYKKYKLVLTENWSYVSEIANGKPAYSSASGNLWTTKKAFSAGKTYRIELRTSDKTYILYSKVYE